MPCQDSLNLGGAFSLVGLDCAVSEAHRQARETVIVFRWVSMPTGLTPTVDSASPPTDGPPVGPTWPVIWGEWVLSVAVQPCHDRCAIPST